MSQQSAPLQSANAAPASNAAPCRLLQRKCACGKNTAGGGDCGPCERKARRIQRRAAGARPESTSVPDSVHEVLRSSGSPLDAPTRSFFESRLGHDFSHVRVHTDARAAESAAAVGSLAYTVGRDVVFGAGRYAPGTATGNRLLAHELAHTIQQGGGGPRVAAYLQVGRADDASEREADAVADSVLSSVGVPAVPLSINRHRPHALRRQETTRDEELHEGVRSRAEKMFSDEPEAQKPVHVSPPENPVCGPDVTVPVIVAKHMVVGAFKGWNLLSKNLACEALLHPAVSLIAWDINELHDQDWIHDYYGTDCATRGATPSCLSSIQIIKGCHYAGSVNYVIFGTMCRLCHDYFLATGDPRFFLYSKAGMLKLIDLYKGGGSPLQSEPSANFEQSKAWASAGFDGWPSGGSTPKGDRPNCKPTCSEPYDGPRFTVTWRPFDI